MSSLHPQQLRSLNDMLSAERVLRASSEDTIRDLRQLLLDAAIRLDGRRMDGIHRADPHAPGNWTTAQWKKFMDEIPAASSWGIATSRQSSPQAEEQRVKEILAELEKVTRELQSAKQQLDEIEKKRNEPPVNTFPAPAMILNGSIAPTLTLQEQTKAALKKIPKRLPEIQKVFDGGGRTGGDLQKAFSRVYLILYLIGKLRLSSTMEIDGLLGGATDASPRSSSLRHVMEEMIEKKLLIAELLSMNMPKTALKIVRLSPTGEALYRELFKSAPLENDWARMIRLHEGAKYVEHTLAVLYFGVHARKRDYYVCVLPDVDGNAVPDIWIARGEEALYVEVELGSKDHTTKWKNLAALNDGSVALCAGTSKLRERYASDCKLDESETIRGGFAIDLEMLVKHKYMDVNSSTPLWIDTW